jgi:hypothetical protein
MGYAINAALWHKFSRPVLLVQNLFVLHYCWVPNARGTGDTKDFKDRWQVSEWPWMLKRHHLIHPGESGILGSQTQVIQVKVRKLHDYLLPTYLHRRQIICHLIVNKPIIFKFNNKN